MPNSGTRLKANHRDQCGMAFSGCSAGVIVVFQLNDRQPAMIDHMKSPEGLLIDLSGVLHDGPDAIDGSASALQALRKAGLPMRFVSNTSRKTRKALHEQLRGLGFEIEIDEIFTAPRAAHTWLQGRNARTLLLVHPDLEAEFAGLDITQQPEAAEAVLVGDAGEGFNYPRLNTAFRALKEGASLLAIGRNRYFRDAGKLSLDAGPFVVALEFASGSEARIFGKPDRNFFQAAVDDLGLSPEAVLMVGDDVESDVNGALDAGLQAALVRTGKYTPGDEDRTKAACHENLAAIARELLG